MVNVEYGNITGPASKSLMNIQGKDHCGRDNHRRSQQHKQYWTRMRQNKEEEKEEELRSISISRMRQNESISRMRQNEEEEETEEETEDKETEEEEELLNPPNILRIERAMKQGISQVVNVNQSACQTATSSLAPTIAVINNDPVSHSIDSTCVFQCAAGGARQISTASTAVDFKFSSFDTLPNIFDSTSFFSSFDFPRRSITKF